jgi:hypothetical protein
MYLMTSWFALVCGSAFGQQVNPNGLPPCPNIDHSIKDDIQRVSNWNNCWGKHVWEFVNKGQVFEGEFQRGKPNGYGIYIWSNGDKHVGFYRDGAKHGQGTNTFRNGEEYVGEFKDDKWNGQGTYNYSNGDRYQGEFKDNKKHGQGTYNHSNGDRYQGEFKDKKKHGQGTYNHSNGDRYQGEFKDNKKHGQGTFYHLADNQYKGDRYQGEFKDDKRHGQGTLTKANGTKYEGIFENDNFVREAKVNLPNLNSNVAANTDLTEIDRERQQLAEERRRLEEDRRQQQVARERQRLDEEARHRNDVEKERQQLAERNQAASKPTQASDKNSKRKALLIGNDRYQSVPVLKNARTDAQAMGQALAKLGYKVWVKTDLNRKDMQAAIRQFRSEVQGGDEVVIFYAGHAVQIASANYLLPTDIAGASEDEVKDEAIQLQRLLEDMGERKTQITLALIDACRDNPFQKNGRNIGGRGLAPTTAATGQMIIFSAGVGQQALDRLSNDDRDPNGLFTRIFIQEMKNPGIRIDNLAREVRKKVVEAAKSVGHDQVPAIYDQVVGDFYFLQ